MSECLVEHGSHKGIARMSACGRYRYSLLRYGDLLLGSAPPVVFIMLNPSTADALVDDPTIRRCMGFTRRLDATGLFVVNLFALRATNPDELLTAADPIGPDNDASVAEVLGTLTTGTVIAAWGAHKAVTEARVQVVQDIAGDRLHCLGVTASGAPRHPLYLPKDAPLVRWPVRP